MLLVCCICLCFDVVRVADLFLFVCHRLPLQPKLDALSVSILVKCKFKITINLKQWQLDLGLPYVKFDLVSCRPCLSSVSDIFV